MLRGRGKVRDFFKKTGRKLLRAAKDLGPSLWKELGPSLITLTSNAALQKANQKGLISDKMTNLGSQFAQQQAKKVAEKEIDQTENQKLASRMISDRSQAILAKLLQRGQGVSRLGDGVSRLGDGVGRLGGYGVSRLGDGVGRLGGHGVSRIGGQLSGLYEREAMTSGDRF